MRALKENGSCIIIDGKFFIQQYYCAGILTQSSLYIISAIQYQIWEEFRDRTRIEFKRTGSKLSSKRLQELIGNLDLVDDDDQHEKLITQKLLNKTADEIKLELITTRQETLATALGLNVVEDEIESGVHIANKIKANRIKDVNYCVERNIILLFKQVWESTQRDSKEILIYKLIIKNSIMNRRQILVSENI